MQIGLHRPARTFFITVVVTVGGVFVSRAGAQVPDSSPSGGMGPPLFTVSFGTGLITDIPHAPLLEPLPLGLVSIGLPIGDSLTMELEAARWSGSGEAVDRFHSRSESANAHSVSANLLFRSGTSRLGLLAGVGLGVQRATQETTTTTFFRDSIPQVTSSRFRQWDLPGQLIGGIDLNLTRYLSVFATGRWRIVGDAGDSMVIGGVRVAPPIRAVHARGDEDSVVSANGSDVRITGMDGTDRKGTLVSLSADFVVIRERTLTVSIPIEEVRQIAKLSHRARNWGRKAALFGFLAGTLADCGGSHAGECASPIPGGFFAAIAAGIAATAGVRTDAASANRNVIYRAP